MGLTTLHPGLAYGAGIAAENLKSGECVKLSGADLFSKITDAQDNIFGVVYRDVTSGDYVTVYTQGGVYEIENYDLSIQAGDKLEVNPSTAMLRKATDGPVVGIAITVTSSELKFKLTV